MRFLIFAFLLGTCLAKPDTSQIGYANGRIIGGEEAEPHKYPWQVSFRSFGSHICGGSIINEYQVISAAHCVEGQWAFLDSVVAGAHKRNFESGHQKRNIAKMEAHEDHNDPRFNNDVSIITVTQPFDFSDPHVQPIGMFKASLDDPIAPGTTCIATGWGQTQGLFPTLPNALQVVEIDVISKEDCELDYAGYIQPGMICAGTQGAGTCSGDSGGPLVCPDANGDMKLAGLVSFGAGDCSASSVFARVSYYEEWIAAHTN